MTPAAVRLAAWAAPHRLIGLGESTHGTHGIFQLKADVIRSLVTDHHLAALGLEASAAECARIDAYLRGENIDVREALANQRFWTWDTEELLDLLVWLRAHNDGGGDVRLFGFDMQFPALAAQDCARLTTVPVWVLDALGHDASVDWFSKLPRATREEVAEAASTAAAAAEATADDWQARLAARSFAQGAAMRANMADIWAIREESMAANVAYVLSVLPADRPVALWAHNGHVGRGRYHETLMMGGRLGERFGESYFVVGLFCGAGTVRALGVSNAPEVVEMPAPRAGSIESVLEDAEDALALLRRTDQPAFTEPHCEWVIGGVVSADPDRDTREVVPANCYDALAFTGPSEATRANPTGERPARGDARQCGDWLVTSIAPRGGYAVGSSSGSLVTVERSGDTGVDWGYATLTATGDERVVNLRTRLSSARSAVVLVTERHDGEAAVTVLSRGPDSHCADYKLGGPDIERVRLCLSGVGSLAIESVTP